MIITVFVSTDNIKNAKPYSSNQCPIALALRERVDLVRYGTDWRVKRSPNWNRWVVEAFGGRDGFVTTQLPDEAGEFAKSFDAGDVVFPFAFELDVWRPQTG